MKIIQEQETYGKILLFDPFFLDEAYDDLITKFKASPLYKNLQFKPTFTHKVVGQPDGDWFSRITFIFAYYNINWQARIIYTQKLLADDLFIMNTIKAYPNKSKYQHT